MKTKLEKIEIKQELSLYIDLESILTGSLQEVSKNILNIEDRLRKEHQLIIQEPNKFEKFNLRIEQDWDELYELKIDGVRLETDEEFNKRIESTKKRSLAAKKSSKESIKKKEKEELETYLRLQKKFTHLEK